MFRTLYNQAKLVLKVQPVSPVLIKAAGAGLDPTRPEMEFVTTQSSVGRVEYLPGSSLKGAMRSFSERLLLAVGKRACDPLDKKSPCAEREHRSYSRQCDACKLFGSPNMAGRLRVIDGLPWQPTATEEERKEGRDALHRETRANVAIDRASGASSTKGLFDMDVLVGGSLYPEILLRNYQLWQLALVNLAIAEFNGGYQQVGSGKSRGLGRVSVGIELLEVRQLGQLANADELRGVGAASGDNQRIHRLPEGDRCALPEGASRLAGNPIATGSFKGDEAKKVLDAVLASDPWRQFLGVPA